VKVRCVSPARRFACLSKSSLSRTVVLMRHSISARHKYVNRGLTMNWIKL
jgi:hypothetical protein